jgi:8-oxo-dGTP diphosphatase
MQKVTIAIIEKCGKVLIAKRSKGDPLKDTWEFPGGKVERGETPEECLRRELREELGIEAEIGNFMCSTLHTYDHISIELLAYSVIRYSGTVKALDHGELKWISLCDIGNYTFPEANRPILTHLARKN